jgi:two-component system cell cycle response regulator
MTTSVGVALKIDDADSPESIVKRADIALYKAKNDGRNCIVFAAA